MPRYILIDRETGFIWGDTADYAAQLRPADWYDMTPDGAAQLLDEYLRAPCATYDITTRDNRAAVYDVYRDRPGSDSVAVITDGQDQEQIDAVERDCQYVCSLTRAREE